MYTVANSSTGAEMVVEILRRHFEPTLEMLRQAIQACPEELWDARAARDELLKDFETFQKETEPDEEKADALTERLRAGKQDFYAWWSTVIQSAPGQYATPEEIAALADEGRLWEWINSTIQTRILEYEIGITKKAAAAPGVTSGARQSKRPAS